MAKEIYDNDINKYVDWGGDESTGWLPVSGRAVQKFIKDTLEKRIGYVFEDSDNKRCVGFADEDDYNIYIADPAHHQDLIVYSWYSDLPQTLDHTAYYGPIDYKITPELAPIEITELLSTESMKVSSSTNLPYVYVVLPQPYGIEKIVTEHGEDITNEFVFTGSFWFNSLEYKLYEFHLSSTLSLDVNINITFVKTNA